MSVINVTWLKIACLEFYMTHSYLHVSGHVSLCGLFIGGCSG